MDYMFIMIAYFDDYYLLILACLCDCKYTCNSLQLSCIMSLGQAIG